MYNIYSRLNVAGSDYDTIISEQEAAYEWIKGHANFKPRLSLDWTQAIIRVFWDVPTWDTVLESYDSPEAIRAYIDAHSAEWNNPDDV